jgi:hypothetical protein
VKKKAHDIEATPLLSRKSSSSSTWDFTSKFICLWFFCNFYVFLFCEVTRFCCVITISNVLK